VADLKTGDRVRVYLDSRIRVPDGWYTGTIFRIDPYSAHRSFYWVELDPEVQQRLGLRNISVLNPKNIEKLEPET
jgi:hypothetical protein